MWSSENGFVWSFLPHWRTVRNPVCVVAADIPDRELSCVGFWMEDMRSYMITYDEEDAVSPYRCWVSEDEFTLFRRTSRDARATRQNRQTKSLPQNWTTEGIWTLRSELTCSDLSLRPNSVNVCRCQLLSRQTSSETLVITASKIHRLRSSWKSMLRDSLWCHWGFSEQCPVLHQFHIKAESLRSAQCPTQKFGGTRWRSLN